MSKYAIVDNQSDYIWGIFDDPKSAQETIKEQNTPSFYRIEEIADVSKYIVDGKIIKQHYEG